MHPRLLYGTPQNKIYNRWLLIEAFDLRSGEKKANQTELDELANAKHKTIVDFFILENGRVYAVDKILIGFINHTVRIYRNTMTNIEIC